ncbi:MAG: alanine racemase [Proteobacteria bacterium]|nr:alanine racemase [Pseudomonadota bacterium]MBU1737677.1 alanine racemase [Pseudomonadota bacterium]
MAEVTPSGSWNRIEINLENLQANYRNLSNLAGPDARVMPVVKSDAYGHGLVEVAAALADIGASVFGVAETEEGVRLRKAGIEGEIIVLLGAMAENFSEIIRYALAPVVYDLAMIKELSARAEKEGKKVPVHLKIDTGMGRLGIMPDEVDEYLELFSELAGVELAGVLSHFPMADSSDQSATDTQTAVFSQLVKKIHERFAGSVSHIANSAAAIRNPGSRLNMIRPGIALYGCCPSAGSDFCSGITLQPVMSFKTRVIQVKEVPAGYGVSYGHQFTTTRPTRLAVLPVGYDDGYLRRLSGRAEVLIGGKRVPVVGRICMNACMADITDLDRVQAGDEVVLMGRQGLEEISADEIAGWLETISYEVLCTFGGSNHRFYV